ACGWFWEFWNYWAAAKWHYIFPMFQSWKIFEMAVPGYLGFLLFALECFVVYVTASYLLRICKRKSDRLADSAGSVRDLSLGSRHGHAQHSRLTWKCFQGK